VILYIKVRDQIHAYISESREPTIHQKGIQQHAHCAMLHDALDESRERETPRYAALQEAALTFKPQTQSFECSCVHIQRNAHIILFVW
jgi:hypothetical protein